MATPKFLVNPSADDLLTTGEAAELTKLSRSWFEKKRCEGGGPPFLKRGNSVRYLRGQLMDWWTKERDKDGFESDFTIKKLDMARNKMNPIRTPKKMGLAHKRKNP